MALWQLSSLGEATLPLGSLRFTGHIAMHLMHCGDQMIVHPRFPVVFFRLCGPWKMLCQGRNRFYMEGNYGQGDRTPSFRATDGTRSPEVLEAPARSTAAFSAHGRRSINGSRRQCALPLTTFGRLKSACSQPASRAHKMHKTSCVPRRIYFQRLAAALTSDRCSRTLDQ
jgi:hypothetical protein